VLRHNPRAWEDPWVLGPVRLTHYHPPPPPQTRPASAPATAPSP
jgi:hypothetical protein